MATPPPIGNTLASGSRDKITGVACGIGAGALWGLVFLAPELARQFSPLELSICRYVCYGAIAMALIAPRWSALMAHIGRREWWMLAWLALTGNTLYFLLMSNAVQIGGIAMTSLVIGFLPVAITVIGSREQGAIPLRRLWPSLLLCALGVVCIGWQALAGPRVDTDGRQLIGFLCAIGALASWTAFAIGNARSLEQLHDVSAHDWSLLLGIATGAQNIVLIPIAFAIQDAQRSDSEWIRFGAVCAGVSVLASIFGNALWNRMSRLLPLTLVGQMILFETLFALVYGFAWEQRLPTLLEIAAMVLVALSVLSCLAVHRTPRAIEAVA